MSETKWWRDRDEMLLLLYSEWLDADQHAMTSPADDPRTHTDLIKEFMDSRQQSQQRGTS